MGDHKYIWLAPKCATYHYHDDRCWCSTPEELVCEECGAKPIAYVRAGKPTAELVSDLAAARARIAELEARLASLTSVSEEDVERAARAMAASDGMNPDWICNYHTGPKPTGPWRPTPLNPDDTTAYAPKEGK